MSSQPDASTWAVNECADAELGDLRRTKRLVELANVWPSTPQPHGPKPVAMAPCAKPLIASSLRTTSSRTTSCIAISSRPTAVLPRSPGCWRCKRPPKSTGRGPCDHGLGAPWPSGLSGSARPSHAGVHARASPLGAFGTARVARDPDDSGQRTRRKQWPMRQQESQQWRTSREAVVRARGGGAHTRLVSVGDREAEVLDLLAAERPAGSPLGRASWDRCGDAPEHSVWATVEAQPVVEHRILQVPHRGLQPAATPRWRGGFVL